MVQLPPNDFRCVHITSQPTGDGQGALPSDCLLTFVNSTILEKKNCSLKLHVCRSDGESRQ